MWRTVPDHHLLLAESRQVRAAAGAPLLHTGYCVQRVTINKNDQDHPSKPPLSTARPNYCVVDGGASERLNYWCERAALRTAAASDIGL